jgi:hypothetical protein
MKARKVVSGATAVALALAGVFVGTGMASAEEEVPAPIVEVVEQTPAEVVAEPVVEEVPPAPEVVAQVTVEPEVPASQPETEKNSFQEVAPNPSASPETQPDMICTESGEGWSDKTDTTGDPATVTFTADAGFLIDAYCVKAGTTKHIITVDPPASFVVIDHPEKDSVSHFQVHQIPIPDEQGPSCTTVTGAQTIVGDGVLTVDGGWDTTSINVPFSGTLADIGTVLDVTASDTQYLGLHIDTAEGTIVFEEEPSYGGNLWSESAWDGVGTGMGYAAFGSIEEYIAQNGDVVVTGIRLLYTHPEASSTTVESFTIGCTVYTIEGDDDAPVPALYNAEPTPPTCDVAGSFSVEDGVYVLDRITVTVTRGTDSNGDYVLIEVEAHEGYTLSGLSPAWEPLEEGVSAYRYVDLEPAIGYQSEDVEAPCFLVPGDEPVTLDLPETVDECGVEDDDVNLPADKPGVEYSFKSDDVESADYWTVVAEVTEGYVVDVVPAGWVSEGEGVYSYPSQLTNEVCDGGTTPPGTTPGSNPKPASNPTGSLAVTGGDMSPLLPLAGGLTFALGIVLMLMRRFAHR